MPRMDKVEGRDLQGTWGGNLAEVGLPGGRWDGASKGDHVITKKLWVTTWRSLGTIPCGHRCTHTHTCPLLGHEDR